MATRSAITPPSAPTSGAVPRSTTVTGRPSSRQAEAISEPVNPPPMTSTRRGLAARRWRRRWASSRPRRVIDTLERRLGRVGPGARPRAGGDEEAVERDGLPIGQADPLGREVQARRRDAQPPLASVSVLAPFSIVATD